MDTNHPLTTPHKPLRRILLHALLVLALLQTTGAGAQETIRFDRYEHDFGTIDEDGGTQETTFRFTNNTTTPIAIARILSSCGCTTSTYTREAILPGKEGTIHVTYNPAGRPGVFRRTLTVLMDGADLRTILLVKGRVKAGKTRKHAGYPYTMGNLQLRNTLLRFHPTRTGTSSLRQTQSILVVNQGDTPLTTHFITPTENLQARMQPDTLMPDQQGEIIITLTRKTDETASPLCISLTEAVQEKDKEKGEKEGKERLLIKLTTEQCRRK